MQQESCHGPWEMLAYFWAEGKKYLNSQSNLVLKKVSIDLNHFVLSKRELEDTGFVQNLQQYF